MKIFVKFAPHSEDVVTGNLLIVTICDPDVVSLPGTKITR